MHNTETREWLLYLTFDHELSNKSKNVILAFEKRELVVECEKRGRTKDFKITRTWSSICLYSQWCKINKDELLYQPSREYDVIWATYEIEVAILVSNPSITCRNQRGKCKVDIGIFKQRVLNIVTHDWPERTVLRDFEDEGKNNKWSWLNN